MALVRKTQVEEPRAADVRALRKMLEVSPGLWRAIGDLAHVTQHTVMQSNSFGPGLRTALEVGIKDIKREYGYEEARGLERMLIDQIVVTWLQLQRTQIRYESILQQDVSLPRADYWERRVNAANTRYLRACETLARIRKLSRPSAVQVNIGRQQVNVAQTAKREYGDSGEQIKTINVDQLAPPSDP